MRKKDAAKANAAYAQVIHGAADATLPLVRADASPPFGYKCADAPLHQSVAVDITLQP